MIRLYRHVWLAAAALATTTGAASAADLTVTLKDHQFSPANLEAPANEAISLTVINEDPSPAEFESNALKVEKIVSGKSKVVIKIKPQKPGTYEFVDEFHEDMAKGTLTVK